MEGAVFTYIYIYDLLYNIVRSMNTLYIAYIIYYLYIIELVVMVLEKEEATEH